MSTSDDDDYTVDSDTEESLNEIASAITDFRILIREFMAHPRPPTIQGLLQHGVFVEMVRLSGILIAMGATECPSPLGTVATALNINRSHKILERMNRADQLRKIGDEL